MDPLFAAAAFVFGLLFGSFLNVCIYRMPRRILLQEQLEQTRAQTDVPASEDIERLRREVASFSVVSPGSACPGCHQPIRAYDNIPVISWLVLRGRCRHCKSPISPRYAIVELVTAFSFLLAYVLLGRHVRGSALDAALITAKYCVLSFLVIGLTFIDAEWKLLPDALTIPGISAGVIFSVFVPVVDVIFLYLHSLPPGSFHWPLGWPTSVTGILRALSLCESLLGALVGAGLFYLIAVFYKYARGREGMGLGDVKLMALVGAFLGVRLTLLTVFGASLAGSIFGISTLLVVWNRRTQRRMTKCREPRELARKRAWRSAKLLYANFAIPFGVFLAPMALISAYFGPLFLRWYGRLF